MAHFTYLSPFIPDENWQEFTAALIVATGIAVVCARVTSVLRKPHSSALQGAVIPKPRVDALGFLDWFMELFVRHYESILGKNRREHVGFTASLFLFILVSNLLGLVPGMPAITTTVWVNVGLAFVVFFHFNWHGVKTHGFLGYLKHFCGPVWWLAWFMLPLEIFSTVLRILTLNLRLYWNISADHLVLGTFTDLIGPVAIPFYALGTFVCFMQAFVFATLTMVYISLATQHGEEHH